MRSVPRPARFLIVAAACSLLYGLGDILTCALVDSKDPGTSWQALSCLAAFMFPVVCAGSLTPLLALLDRRHEQRSREALARKLDYSAIAAMERDIWGKTFEHEGAPETVRPVRMVAGKTCICKRCMTPYARISGLCPRCYRAERVQARSRHTWR